MKTDSLFYRLFQTYPQLLFELVGISGNSSQSYRFRSVEIKQTAFRVDGVFVPPENNTDLPFFFVEVQFQPELTFYSRFFAEIFLYLRQYQPLNPWQAVVIYPSRRLDIGNSQPYTELLESERVSRIYLDELVTNRSGSLSFRLLSLIIAPGTEAISQARELVIQTQETIEERQQQLQLFDLIETIIVYKLPRLSREEIQRMLGFTEMDYRQTQFYQDVFAEGQKEESLNLVLRLLRVRFGELETSVTERVRQLNLTQLEALAEALLGFVSVDDVKTWLLNNI